MTVIRISVAAAICYILWAGTSASAEGFVWTNEDADLLANAVSSGMYGQIASVWIEQDGEHFAANMMSGSGGNRIYVIPEFAVVVVLTKNDFRDRDAQSKSDGFFTDEIVKRLNSG